MKISYKILTYTWSLVILIGSITPGNYIPKTDFTFFDPNSLAHFLFYAILVFLTLKWKKVNSNQRSLAVYTFCFTVIYGILIELIQGNFIPGRFGDIYDVIMNTIGSIIGLVFYFFSKKITK